MALERMRSRIVDLTLTCGVLALAAPVPAWAQLGENVALWDRQTAVARVPDGHIIRLRLADGTRAGGPIQRWNAYSATLGPYLGYAETDTVIALATIDTMWLRVYRARRGAVIGGVVVGALGLGLGSTASSLCPDVNRAKACAQGALASTAIGVAIGGLVGAALGAGSPGWRRLHPREGGPRLDAPPGSLVTLTVPGDSAAADPRAIALMRTRPDALVRLNFSDRPDLAGYVRRAGARQAVLATVVGAQAEGPVSLASLDAIWERGTASRTGSIVAMLVGAAAGAYVATESSACDPGNRCTLSALGDGVIGGLAGWVVGGRIGAAFPKWERRY